MSTRASSTPNPAITINPSSPDYTPVNASIRDDYNVDLDNNRLEVTLVIDFYPFDFHNYKWHLYDNERVYNNAIVFTDNEKLNWIKCTLYNFIPFSLSKSNQPSLVTSYNSSDFTEINQWDIMNMTHTHSLNNLDNSDIIDTNFRNTALNALNVDGSWLQSTFGRCFDFRMALNANKYFHNVSNTNFDNVLASANADQSIANEYRIWNDGMGMNRVTISISTSLDSAEQRTYALRFVNPYSRELQTIFIPVIKNNSQSSKIIYNYVEGSLICTGLDDKVDVRVESASGNKANVFIRKTDFGGNWNKITPRITFKLKKRNI